MNQDGNSDILSNYDWGEEWEEGVMGENERWK